MSIPVIPKLLSRACVTVSSLAILGSVGFLTPAAVEAKTVSIQTNWDTRLNAVKPSSNNLVIWVNLKNQRLAVMNKVTKKMVISYQILTGSDENPTPTGIFAINNNREISNTNSIELNGSYGTANVAVWNSFIDNSIAFHNAPWRQPWEFGNTKRRILNGSHGCVNMDLDDARDLYKRTYVGTAVIVTN